MSEYHTAKTEFIDKKALVEACEKMGWKVESHDKAVEINSGYGPKRKAHIVVRRGQFGGCADFGFEKQGDKYVLHRDHMDNHRVKDGEIKARYFEARLNHSIKGRAKYRKSSRVETADEIRITINTNY